MAPDGFNTLSRMLAEVLLNSLWQGLALTALVWCGLRLAPRTGAATRFGIWWSTLVVVLALPFARLVTASPDGEGSLVRPAAIHLSAAWPLVFVAVWILIAAVLLGRLAWSYGYVRWLARTSSPAEARWQERVALITGSRTVRVLISQETSVPMVIGVLRPAILIPRALLSEFSAGEFNQILLHEWAHIRRRDAWTNYALELAQALFFFQPAVWCIGRLLRLEREIACDDAVVRSTGDPVPYAGCLARLVELTACPPVSLSPGASGDGRDLFRRVERLLAWTGAARFSALRFATASLALLAAAAYVREAPALVDIPAPSLALVAPRPAIEASRQRLVAEGRILHANILIDTASARLETAERMVRSANRQMRLAVQIAEGNGGVPMSRVACQQPAVPRSSPRLNKI